jgi:hypothetical protein
MPFEELDGYRVVEDACFAAAHADAVETHVYLDTGGDETFAREVLDVGERTCFLHALCRTVVDTHVRVAARRLPVGEQA